MKSVTDFLFEKVLDTKDRAKLKEDDFALPNRRYPIHDKAHARAALSMVSRFGTPEEKEIVRKKVYSRYPEMVKT